MAGTVAITSPATDNETGHDSSSLPIVWTFTGTGGATRVQYRVTMERSGDSSHTLIIDTGFITGSATTYTVTGLANGIFYDVKVYVTDTAGATASATRTVVARFTRAVPPLLTVTVLEQGLNVAVSNPTSGSRPQVLRNRLYRRLAGSGSDWTQVAVVGVNGSYVDRETRSGTAYEYFARGEQ